MCCMLTSLQNIKQCCRLHKPTVTRDQEKTKIETSTERDPMEQL